MKLHAADVAFGCFLLCLVMIGVLTGFAKETFVTVFGVGAVISFFVMLLSLKA